MKQLFKKILLLTLLTMLIVTPSIGFAKENKDKKQKGNYEPKKEQSKDYKVGESKERDDDDDNDNSKNKKDIKCVRAYGHFFAPGWLKKNSGYNFNDYAEHCYIPFGISKKFRGDNASTTPPTPDTTAPVISSIVFNPSRNQSDVRWVTNEYSDSTVFWNTNPSVDTSQTAVNKIQNNHFTKNHQILLKNLSPDTMYYVVVRSKDSAGNSSLSSVHSFRTKPVSTDTQYPVISSVVTSISTSTIGIGWKTNENTTDRVYYSTSLPVIINASTTSYVSNASTTKIHALTVSGLTPNTTYYLVIESTDTAGNVTTSATFSAKTIALPVVVDTTAPVISSILATAGASTTTISWITNEIATSKVFYSTTTPLVENASTTLSVLNNGLVTSHSMDLSGLATSTVYYFKILSVDNSGNTATSTEFSTTTLAQ